MNPSRRSAAHSLLAAALLLSACATESAAQFETPDGTVRHVITSIENQNPRVLWEALPPSYQRDVTTMIRESAAAADRDLHQAAFSAMSKVVIVLRDKRDFILSQPFLAGTTDRNEAEQRWGSVVGVFDVLVHSDLANLDRMSSIDVGRFLDETGTRLMKHMASVAELAPDDPMARFQQVSVQLVSRDGDRAIVRLTGPDIKPDDETVQLVRVEGRWVPAELADNWQSHMADWRRNLSAMSEEQRRRDKPQMLAMFAAMGSVADQLAEATTQEEFNRAAEGALPILFGFMMMGAMGQQGN